MIAYGSVCSGIEAATLAWQPLGWKASWFAEIEKFPSRVLAHRWPSVPNLGDMTLLPDYIRNGLIEAPDVLVGGTPCQAFSVAGLRNSLNDDRGLLSIKFVEIADAIDEQQPCVVLWENVPGVLNTKDNAFGCFLGAMCGEEVALQPPGKRWSNAGVVYGPKRALGWRVLDAQYFGVPQRRRRVFVVASARKGFDPIKVLFESESMRRGTPPSRETGQTVAALTANGVGTCGADDNQGQAGHLICMAHGRNNGGENVVAIQNATRGKSQNGIGISSNDVMYTLDQGSQHGVALDTVVRRLTPMECERLQGMPDNHTNVPGAADEPRYKAIGNSMAVPVIQWLGKRIGAYLNGI